jgi:hypothetical protein
MNRDLRFLLLVFLGLQAFLGQACASPAERFHQANHLYEQGKVRDSIPIYRELISSNYHSPSIHFNLGNACLQAGQLGNAIVAYRHALRMSPRDPKVRQNLAIARERAGQSAPPQWKSWLSYLSLNEWTALAFFSLASSCGVGALWQLRPKFRETLSSLLAVSLLCLAASTASLIVLAQDQMQPGFVVTTKEISLRRGPFDESPVIATATDGSEFRVTDQKGSSSWIEITGEKNRSGWVQSKNGVLLYAP